MNYNKNHEFKIDIILFIIISISGLLNIFFNKLFLSIIFISFVIFFIIKYIFFYATYDKDDWEKQDISGTKR